MPSGDARHLRLVADPRDRGGAQSDGAVAGGTLAGSGALSGARAADGESAGGGTIGGAAPRGFDWLVELELVAPDVTLPPGCTAQAITAAEGSLGLTFPPQQVEFLKATDGVYDAESYHWFAWSLERVVDENFEPERPRDLLVIGDDAASGWFCLSLHDAGEGVLHYSRTTGARRMIAPDVRGLWLGWFGGTINV